MELALALNRLWHRRIWVALGVAVAVFAGILGARALKKTTYSAASTQMVVDAPSSALGSLKTSLVPFTARAIVYARLMTSPAALQYIGQAAGIPGNEIAAEGPAEIGAPTAIHAPSIEVDGRLQVPEEKYVLRFDQNPDLPTVDISSEAPTTAQAVALANGAVTGFANYLHALDDKTAVPTHQQVRIRELGSAQGGVVAAGTGSKLGVLIGVLILIMWCLGILFFAHVREQLRAPDRSRHEIDEIDEDMSRLLHTRAVVAVGGHGDSENGADANGNGANGTRVILPHGIEGDDDDGTADRHGHSSAHDR